MQNLCLFLQSADGGVKGESGTGEEGKELEGQEVWQKWQQKDEEALDEEFQKNLEVRGTWPVVP